MKDIKAVLKIFQTGAITITAPSVQNVQIAVERIYPLVYEYRKAKPPQSKNVSQNNDKKSKKGIKKSSNIIDEEELTDSISELTDEDSDLESSDSEENDYSDKSD
jgi:transcription initiation factor TFIID TATA-box-binding protein